MPMEMRLARIVSSGLLVDDRTASSSSTELGVYTFSRYVWKLTALSLSSIKLVHSVTLTQSAPGFDFFAFDPKLM